MINIVSILVDLVQSIISLDLFIIFVCSFCCLSLFSLVIHFLSGKRLIYN